MTSTATATATTTTSSSSSSSSSSSDVLPVQPTTFKDKELLNEVTTEDDPNAMSLLTKLRYTWVVIKNFQRSDLQVLTHTTCARNALINGISGGLGIGVLRFAFLGTIPSSANYAVGAFGLISVASWEYCKWKQKVDSQNSKIVIPEQDSIDDELKK